MAVAPGLFRFPKSKCKHGKGVDSDLGATGLIRLFQLAEMVHCLFQGFLVKELNNVIPKPFLCPMSLV